MNKEFNIFVNKITLQATQMGRIESASTTLMEKLVKKYELDVKDVFQQGSIPNGTAVKPDPEGEGGEYDVDLVCICANSADSPEEAIDSLKTTLGEVGYSDKIADDEDDRPCVRLQYADDEIGGFHVDVVPARDSQSEGSIEVPRPGNGWHASDPAAYTTWCQDQGDHFARLVQMLKRWRDHNQTVHSAVSSIVLQVLIHDNEDESEGESDRVARTLRGISDFLEPHTVAPEIKNPVLETEDLAERWSEEDFLEFKSCVSDAADLAETAAELDGHDASVKWRELFGKDFPLIEGGGSSASSPPAPGTTGRKQSAPRHSGWG